MALVVSTSAGNTYTYLRELNQIVSGYVNEKVIPISFGQRKQFDSFPKLCVFTIGLTTKCNLRCTYCCYSGAYRNSRTHGSSSMIS